METFISRSVISLAEGARLARLRWECDTSGPEVCARRSERRNRHSLSSVRGEALNTGGGHNEISVATYCSVYGQLAVDERLRLSGSPDRRSNLRTDNTATAGRSSSLHILSSQASHVPSVCGGLPQRREEMQLGKPGIWCVPTTTGKV